MERSLTSVFEKHLGFPGAGRARVTAEAFVDRVVDRLHHFDEASDDLVRWVEHFFETEHLAEDRRVEFAAFAEGREHPVLEMSLGEQEFVIVDSDRDDELVVVSGAGSMVVQRSAELVSRLKAAELPAPRQHRPNDAFRPSGERVYLVNGQGSVTALDAKAVMTALRGAPLRSEPVARVTDSATRLPNVSKPPVASVVATGRAPSTSAEPRTFAAREVRAMARRDLAGTSAGSVRVLERGGEVRTVSAGAARVWQSLTAHATEHGRRPDGAVAGVTAVALGQQTFAVKAGGVTALVQRPTRTGVAAAPVESSDTGSRADRVMPAWLRELLTGAVRGHYWVDPAAASVSKPAVGLGGWVTAALEQAQAVRVRARVEAQGELDPAPRPVRARPAQPSPQLAGSTIDASVVVVGPTSASSVVVSEQAPVVRYQLNEKGVSEAPPLGRTGALPATTLRTLFTALERTAAYEGRQLRGAVVSVEPPLATSSAEVSSVSQLELDTVPRHLPTAPATRTTIASAAGVTPQVQSVSGRSSHGLFALPFEDAGTLRIGRELDLVMARAFEGVGRVPVSIPATIDTVVRVSGSPERVRIEVPDLRRARPRVEAAPGVMGVDAVDLTALGELQWSTFAARSAPARSAIVAHRPNGPSSKAFAITAEAPGHETSVWTETASPEMDFAAPRLATRSPFAGATALGAMAPASGFSSHDPFSWSSTPETETVSTGRTAQPLYVEPALATAALPLAEINFRRTPLELPGDDSSDPVFAQGAGLGGEEPGTMSFDIPLPLHAQMSGKSLPVFARSRSAGPIGRASASAPAPSSASAAASSAPALSAPTFSRSSALPANGVAPSASPAAKAMPPLRRSPREGFAAGASQVLVERPAADASAPGVAPGGGPAPVSSPASTARVAPAGGTSAPRASSDRGGTARFPAGAAGSSLPSGAAAASSSASPASVGVASPSPAARRASAVDAGFFDGATADTVPTGPAAGRGRPSIGARAYAAEPQIHGAASMNHPAFEAVHVLQQSGAPVRPRRRGATPMRFRYPTSARWWGESSKTTGKASYAGRLAATGAVVAASPAAAAGASAPAATPSSPARGSRSTSTSARPLRAGSLAATAVGSSSVADQATFVEGPSFAGDYPPVGERETAYVVLNPDGHAQVMNARAASQVTRARAHGAPVDMAVVAAVPPTAPTLEQMAVPGHDRPHAKAKKDQPKAGATAKTDAMSLQGTVDSLAQRIYHRLRRRLEADRERFGG